MPTKHFERSDDRSARSRLRVAVLFGGRSPQHDVSVLSATNVVNALDPNRYDVLPIFVTKDGRWLMASPQTELSAAATMNGVPQLCLLPGGHGRMLAIPQNEAPFELPPSVGVSKVKCKQDFAAALAEGFRHDSKLLAEEFIAGGKIEFSILPTARYPYRARVRSRPLRPTASTATKPSTSMRTAQRLGCLPNCRRMSRIG